MKNILELLKESDVYITIKYYGLSDLSTSSDLKKIIESSELISNYFNEYFVTDGLSLDNFIDYLFLKKIIKMEEIIPYIKSEENQEKFQELSLKLENISTRLNIGDIIKFINSNFKTVFTVESKVFDLIDVSLDLCIKYQNGISIEVFLYLIENHSYIMFDNYDKLQKRIESEIELFEAIFSKDIVMNVIKYRLVEVGDIIVSIINRGNKDLSIYLNTALDTIIDYGNSIMTILNLDNIMEFHSDISSIYNILKNVNHIQASKFENHMEKSEEIMSQYLEARGQVIEYKIPVGEIIKSLRGDSPWEFKPLLLTHSYDEENDTMNSNLNNPPKQEKSIFDLISININIDDYFTFRQQEYLRAHITAGMSAIYGIINDDELFNESLIWYISYLEFIGGELNYFKADVINDMRLLYSMVKNIFNNKESKNGLIIQSLCYGAAMYICAFTENILRITYKYIKQDEEYIASDIGTMGQYLTVNNEVIKEILGEYQIKHLMFYFGKTQKSNIGYNYRNKLAHWNGINREELSPELVCKLFFLMINIINSIFYYFYEKKRKGKVNN